MIGWVVKHRSLGVGKIVLAGPSGIRVQFLLDGSEATFDKDAFAEGDLHRACLSPGNVCATSSGECTVNAVSRKPVGNQEVHYEITYTATGFRAVAAESDLTPLLNVQT
ncbi:MAG TPA: hypothetical protein VFG14_18660, partial [Chthoniobacteraceae bacterium]|nr:hypothetical protein [Chthoniobacteraceae bacterium]